MNSIELKNITKRYGSFRAVDNLSFEIKQGDFVGFLGVNGAGKSTTVNMMSTILTPDEGEAYLCGYRLGKEDMEIRKSIGVVYQSNVLDDLFTVKENIVTRSRMLGLDDRTIKARLSDLSDILKLQDIMNKRYRVLSGGQKRRCEIAFALMHSPKILFLDEPTTGLDPATRVDVWEAVEQLRSNTDMTVFLTTHYMEEAQSADKIIIINQGKKLAEGTPFELKERFAKDSLKLYFDESSRNRVLEVVGKDNLIATSYGGCVESDNPFAAAETARALRGIVEGFEIIQGKMDDVFLNVTNGLGRAV
ncbi:ABC transporter ATP-binding protein [Butyrivibrio sp. DSM 10294]|uniref:ABC transporter ATP-binding protein n=1 Tax=Butyrivibrio sp. DSM 10294 TaxID=2972457 RepID=UPI00234E658D|nr:ABC transporter ATP-binding protein [Butyrivibrio sp. DSM 10294]MDC7293200.1 ABC transporter ATP-binding protein [Butyrivibrio sp. DSM 10294]